MKKIIVLAISLFASLTIKANINDPIYLDPVKNLIDLELGESKVIEVAIVNAGDFDIKDYELEIQEFIVTDQYKIDPKPLTKNPQSFVNYVKILSGSNVSLIPKQGKFVAKIQIAAPKDYKFGSGYFVYKLSKKGSKKANFVQFVKSLYGYVAINIKNQGKTTVKLKNNSEKRNVNFSIENTGDKLLNVSGKLILTKNNLVIGNFDLIDEKSQENNSLIFPNTSKEVKLVVPSSVKFKKGEKVDAMVLLTDPKLNFSYSEKVKLTVND